MAAGGTSCGRTAGPQRSSRAPPTAVPLPPRSRRHARPRRAAPLTDSAGREGRDAARGTPLSAPLRRPSTSHWRGCPPPVRLYSPPTPSARPRVTSAAGSQLPLVSSAPRGRGRAAIGRFRSAAAAHPPGPWAGRAPRDHVRAGPGAAPCGAACAPAAFGCAPART